MAIRRCERFSDRDPATVTLISDAGRVVFAVSSREYALDHALAAFEERLRALSVSGCEQFASATHSVGFVRCGNGVGWAAVSRMALPADAGDVHAVVFEVAERREIARDIAAAFASSR